jgi:Amidohydrolase
MTRLALAAAFIGGISTTGAGQPVAIHMGSGPPNAAYEARYKLPESRMALNDPLLLEEVLLRHKRLRVLLMHAGWPFLELTVALLYAHPNVYGGPWCVAGGLPAGLLPPLARARRKRVWRTDCVWLGYPRPRRLRH